MRARFDGHRYRDCRWCGGRGCLQCESEANKAYKAEFPDGPKPIAVFKTPEDIDAARSAIGIEALQKAFGPQGGGIAEIINNIGQLKQHHDQTSPMTVGPEAFLEEPGADV